VTETNQILRSIRAQLQREIDAEKYREQSQNPQHAKLTRGKIIGLERAWTIIDQRLLNAKLP
jgi:hypothetical protein